MVRDVALGAAQRRDLARQLIAARSASTASAELTGKDLSLPVDASEVYVALECLRILGEEIG